MYAHNFFIVHTIVVKGKEVIILKLQVGVLYAHFSA